MFMSCFYYGVVLLSNVYVLFDEFDLFLSWMIVYCVFVFKLLCLLMIMFVLGIIVICFVLNCFMIMVVLIMKGIIVFVGMVIVILFVVVNWRYCFVFRSCNVYVVVLICCGVGCVFDVLIMIVCYDDMLFVMRIYWMLFVCKSNVEIDDVVKRILFVLVVWSLILLIDVFVLMLVILI